MLYAYRSFTSFLLGHLLLEAGARSAEDPAVDALPDEPVPGDAPWFPKDIAAWSVRWVLFHLIEELARHAGQGDIIRESIDGVTLYELLAGIEDWPATDWLTPWGKEPVTT